MASRPAPTRSAASFASPASAQAGSKRAWNSATRSVDESWVPRQRVLDVGLAEREADLTEVLAVAAQHGDLTTAETGQQHEAVEAVALDAAVDELGEGVLQGDATLLVEIRRVADA